MKPAGSRPPRIGRMVCLSIGAALLLTSGCRKAADAVAWEAATKSGAAEEYRKFLREHPRSEMAQEARRSLELLDWRQAGAADSVGSYEWYIETHPEGAHAWEAGLRIEKSVAAEESPDEALLKGVRRRWPVYVQKAFERGASPTAKWSNSVSALHAAIAQKTPRMVELLLKKGADPRAATSNRLTPLHWAANENGVEETRLLAAAGADVNARDDAGDTPLHWAARKNAKEVVERLLARGADVNARNASRLTALQEAAYAGNAEAVEALRRHGAPALEYDLLEAVRHNDAAKAESLMAEGVKPDSPAGIYRSTALHAAAAGCRKELVESMVARRANIEAKDTAGATALHYAVRGGCQAVVELLLGRGASVRAQATRPGIAVFVSGFVASVSAPRIETVSGTPLHWAAACGQQAIAERLIAAQADVNAKASGQWTPIYLAADKGHLELVRLLHSRGAKVNLNHESEGSPLHFAASKAIAEYLVAAGASPKVACTSYGTPLHMAAYNGRNEVVEYLLASGLRVDAKGLWSMAVMGASAPVTPAYCAALGGRLDTLKLLESKGVDLNAKGERGETLLHAAAWTGSVAVAEHLIARGVGVDLPGGMPSAYMFSAPHERITPLGVAAEHGHLKLVLALLARGARMNARDDEGSTPLDLAYDEDTWAALERRGAKSGK